MSEYQDIWELHCKDCEHHKNYSCHNQYIKMQIVYGCPLKKFPAQPKEVITAIAKCGGCSRKKEVTQHGEKK